MAGAAEVKVHPGSIFVARGAWAAEGDRSCRNRARGKSACRGTGTMDPATFFLLSVSVLHAPPSAACCGSGLRKGLSKTELTYTSLCSRMTVLRKM